MKSEVFVGGLVVAFLKTLTGLQTLLGLVYLQSILRVLVSNLFFVAHFHVIQLSLRDGA
jgi:hypothetical protein